MISREEQELIDAFYFANEINRCMFNYKVILNDRAGMYSRKDFIAIANILVDVQNGYSVMFEGIDTLRKYYTKCDTHD